MNGRHAHRIGEMFVKLLNKELDNPRIEPIEVLAGLMLCVSAFGDAFKNAKTAPKEYTDAIAAVRRCLESMAAGEPH